jgi:hypothetical protein
MTLTTTLIVNALLSALVVTGLFRLVWFAISKPYDEPSSYTELEPSPKIRDDERPRWAA